MKSIAAFAFLVALFAPSHATESSNIDSAVKAVEVTLSFKVGDDEFNDLQGVAYVGLPMTLYLKHATSLSEYKTSFTVNLLTHKNQQAAQIYLSIQKKRADGWSDADIIETFQYLNDVASFSISDQGLTKLVGEITAKPYLGEIPLAQESADCEQVQLANTSSCCEVPCQDGTFNILRCCGGIRCCGCGTCCFVP